MPTDGRPPRLCRRHASTGPPLIPSTPPRHLTRNVPVSDIHSRAYYTPPHKLPSRSGQSAALYSLRYTIATDTCHHLHPLHMSTPDCFPFCDGWLYGQWKLLYTMHSKPFITAQPVILFSFTTCFGSMYETVVLRLPWFQTCSFCEALFACFYFISIPVN